MSGSLAERRFHTRLLELFGAGGARCSRWRASTPSTAFAVVERTREIGVRLSLGSTRVGASWRSSRRTGAPARRYRPRRRGRRPRSRWGGCSRGCSTASRPTTRRRWQEPPCSWRSPRWRRASSRLSGPRASIRFGRCGRSERRPQLSERVDFALLERVDVARLEDRSSAHRASRRAASPGPAAPSSSRGRGTRRAAAA